MLDKFRSQVAGHDQNRVAEIRHPALSIRQATIIQDLQQGVPDLRVGFFNFIKEDNTVWATPDCFGQLTALFVSHVSGRCAKQARNRMLLAILAHIQADQSFGITKHELCQRFCQLGFPHTGRTDENKRTNRSAGILQTSTRPSDGIRNGMNGFLLPNDVLVEAFLHVEQFFRFRFHHLADRYARPLGNHLGNIIDIHHFVQLVIRFPTVTFFTEITFQAQTFRFLAGSPFIIPFHACLLFLGTQAVQFHFLLL